MQQAMTKTATDTSSSINKSDSGNNGYDEATLSLIAKSIRRISVTRQEFKALLPKQEHNDGNNNYKFDDPLDCDSSSSFPPFRNNIVKLCETSSSTKNNLRSSLSKWLDRIGKNKRRRQKGETKPSTICNNTICPLDVLERYATKARAEHQKTRMSSLSSLSFSVPKAKRQPLRGSLVTQKSQHTALAVYHDGILFEGEVQVVKNYDSHKSNVSNNDSAVLACAGSLYFQLWWFRVIQRLHDGEYDENICNAYGFSVVAVMGDNISSSQQMQLIVSMLILKAPNTCRPMEIGAKYLLYEYTTQHSVDHSNSTSGQNALFQELGQFVLDAPSQLPNPFFSRGGGCRDEKTRSIQPKTFFPGIMLLPSKHLLFSDNTPPTIPSLWDTDDTHQDIDIIPTETGSLVIRCKTANSVMTLLFPKNSNDNDKEWDSFRKQCNTIILKHNAGADDTTNDIWYIKFKTPASFGSFWDTANIAITGTRRILQTHYLTSSSSPSTSVSSKNRDNFRKQIAHQWLDMYPIDAMIHNSTKYTRSITIVKHVGTPFRGQLAWAEFRQEFLALIRRTLEFQHMTKLIHGDIYQANLMIAENAGKNFDTSTGWKLLLIDWDEALRNQPCYRKIDDFNDGEHEQQRQRYPNGLISFPEQYTKYQFINLYFELRDSYYLSTIQKSITEAANGDESRNPNDFFWKGNIGTLLEGDQHHERLLLPAVNAKFKALCDFLGNNG